MSQGSLLTALHAEGVTFASYLDAEWPAVFSSVDAEYDALRHGTGLAIGAPLGLIRIMGADRGTFLQGMLTSDLLTLSTRHSRWACLLTPKGKVETLSLVVPQEHAYWMVVPHGRTQYVTEQLRASVVTEDVVVEDVSESWTLLSLFGPSAAEALPDAYGTIAPEVLLWSIPVYTGSLCCVRADAATLAWKQYLSAGATPVGFLALHIARVTCGMAWFGVDADETCLLPETGWELSAASLTKGCYVGQEVVARAIHRGGVTRHLMGIRCASTDLPVLPTPLYYHDQPCGKLTSIASVPGSGESLGIAMVHRAAWATGAVLRIGDTTLTATPTDLPYLSLPTTAPPVA